MSNSGKPHWTCDNRIEHMPDRTRLAVALSSLEWEQHVPELISDGDVWLVAVPVSNRRHAKPGWNYEYSVIRFRCDEDLFEIEAEDGPWGWDLDQIDFFVRLGCEFGEPDEPEEKS